MIWQVKTISITIDEYLDEAARLEAKRRGISKSELIRRGLVQLLEGRLPVPDDDPWTTLAGFGPEGLSVEPGEIDEVVYGA